MYKPASCMECRLWVMSNIRVDNGLQRHGSSKPSCLQQSSTISYLTQSRAEQEDELLLDLIQKHGLQCWSAIASSLPGRNTKQCSERYFIQNYYAVTYNSDRDTTGIRTISAQMWSRKVGQDTRIWPSCRANLCWAINGQRCELMVFSLNIHLSPWSLLTFPWCTELNIYPGGAATNSERLSLCRLIHPIYRTSNAVKNRWNWMSSPKRGDVRDMVVQRNGVLFRRVQVLEVYTH